jgi:hypothetical protein
MCSQVFTQDNSNDLRQERQSFKAFYITYDVIWKQPDGFHSTGFNFNNHEFKRICLKLGLLENALFISGRSMIESKVTNRRV